MWPLWRGCRLQLALSIAQGGVGGPGTGHAADGQMLSAVVGWGMAGREETGRTSVEKVATDTQRTPETFGPRPRDGPASMKLEGPMGTEHRVERRGAARNPMVIGVGHLRF